MADFWFSPAGTGNGLTAGAPSSSKAALLAFLADERARAISGTPEVLPWTTVTAGVDTDYDTHRPEGGLLAYVPKQAHCVVKTRVNWVVDQGAWNTGDTDPWLTLGPEHGGIERAGTAADPHHIVLHVGYRASDGKRTTDMPVTQEVRTVSIRSMDPAADWAASGNYTSGKWTGPTVAKSYSWTVQKPRDIRVVINGNRTRDPRTNVKRQIWNGGDNATRQMRPADPYARKKNAVILKDDGTELVMIRGDVWDMDTRTLTNHGWSRLGNIIIKTRAACTMFQGFEFNYCAGPFSMDPAATTAAKGRFFGFRDIKTNNTRYGIQRGHNASDVLNERWHSVGCAQKLWSVGQNSLRWWFDNLLWDGAYVIGDGVVQAGIVAAADSSSGAGVLAIHHVIGESLISGVPVGSNRYTQGDNLDIELLGWSGKHLYGKNLMDGLVDSKAGAFHGNMGVTVCDVYGEDVKRLIRSWTPAHDLVGGRFWSCPWELRDVTGENTTDTNLLTFNKLDSIPETDDMVPFDKFVRWENPSGRAFAQGSLGGGSMQHNDAELIDPQRVVEYRHYDARPSGAIDRGPTTNSNADGDTYKLERPIARPTPVGVKVNGAAVDRGHRLLVTAGQTVTIEPGRALATGETVRYRVIGEHTKTQSGNVLTVTAQTQV